ncbi:MAG: type I glyceraldehyde-3-phosphate dehydrogenase [Candidatus Aenigmarchaeota archaeon]|nr:type I glyceraldehyde-3-phosphate dehydrogenase [Candidatus Aenigmarchaeota archaeon]
MPRLGINGFGRIGRLACRAAIGQGLAVAAINGTAPPATLAHLLQYDSTYGTWEKHVRPAEGAIDVDGQRILVFKEKEPSLIPWSHARVDTVLECSGLFTERDQLMGHLRDPVRKVLVAAPAKGEDLTVVLGVNGHLLRPDHKIISNASCTTNCLAPVAKVLHESFGIREGLMTTVHAYTGDQRLLDGTHKDLRRARAACLSMVPTSTGAAKAIGKVLPQLEGKLQGFAIRVPVPAVSLVDLTVVLERAASAAEINQAFQAAAAGPLKGILDTCSLPLVSADFRGNPHSAIVDLPSTTAVGPLAKVLAWYDNEWAYALRLVELARKTGDA